MDLLAPMRRRAAEHPRFDGPLHAVQEPATGAPLVELRLARAADVDREARRAGAAQAAWAATPFDRRAAILRRAADLLLERAKAFNAWNQRESGSIGPKCDWELAASVEQLHYCAGLAALPTGQIVPSALPGRVNLWSRVPIGVVGVITPWNYPLLLAMRSVAPALALGNAVLLKPDVQTTVSGGLLLEALFEDAGLPAGVFGVLPGGADVGQALVQHPAVGMISFTGSSAVGRQVGSLCGGLLKKVALELGGNNAFVVLEDADIETAASHGAWGAFLHQGQICMQAGRHLVHERVAEAYAQALTRHATALAVGDPVSGAVHLGPIVNARQHAKVAAMVDEAVAAGATLRTGGPGEALYYRPTVLTGVTPAMRAWGEEIFGPVAPITPFANDEDLVEQVNASPYGLSASIHTRDIGRGLRLARRFATGMVHVNDQPVNAEFNVPFGGMGASGNGGRFGGLANLEEFTQSQWVSYTETPLAYPF